MVTACHPVEPEKFFLNHRFGEKCYKQLPVHVKGQVVFVVSNEHEIKLQLREGICSWKPPHNKHGDTPEIGANKFAAERILFTGKKLPDVEDEWIKLAINRLQRKQRDEITQRVQTLLNNGHPTQTNT